MNVGVRKIISGGQTGVDQGALEYALQYHVPCGGFCPKGRKCETGRIPDHFPMTETESSKYSVRTRLNIEHSDGTLILLNGEKIGKGTALTIDLSNFLAKPYLILDLNSQMEDMIKEFEKWVLVHDIQILNIAGNRESQSPGIQKQTFEILLQLIAKS
jgi:hypothetical protein